MKAQKRSNGSWGAVKIAGVLVALLGVAIGLYGLYGLLSPAAFGSIRQYPNGRANFTASAGLNLTRFNSTRMAGYTMGMRAGPYDLAIGVLMLLLGIVTLKYASLRVSIDR